MATAGDQDYNRALDALEKGHLATALEATESALMSNAQDSGYWQLYSVLLAQAGRAEEAEKAKAKAEEHGLGEVDSLLMIAAEAGAAQNWNKAATACEKALELAPERGEIWASYAAHLLEGGYQNDAVEASAKAVELISDDPQIWYLRGRILRLTKQHPEAIEAFQSALELDANLAVAWYEKGMVHHLEEDTPAAKDCFLRAEKLNPGDPGIQEALAIVSA